KCLPGPTRVWDADTGEGLSIEQFVLERRKWMLGFSGGKVTRVQVADWHELGPKPTVIVKLVSGAELETATTHPILSDRGCGREAGAGAEVGRSRSANRDIHRIFEPVTVRAWWLKPVLGHHVFDRVRLRPRSVGGQMCLAWRQSAHRMDPIDGPAWCRRQVK